MKPPPANPILVIEDDSSLRFSLTKALEFNGYAVVSATDGLEGVALARQLRPAVVVCDVHLPGKEGPAVLEELRRDPQLEALQFIMITGDREGTTQRAGMDLGADDYLAKPFTIEAFLRCVKTRLRRAERHRQADRRALSRLRDTVSRRLPHELLTPLTGIIGMAEVLTEEIEQTTPAEAREMLADIRVSADRLHHTLRNYFGLLDVLDAEASAPVIDSQTGGREAVEMASTAAREVAARHHRVSDLVLELKPAGLPVSESNFSAIVTELTDNAFRYSPKTTPVRVELGEEDGEVRLTVTDRGRGMTAEQIAQIGAFRQFDRTRYEQQGLGLGLTLAQHLIARNGGRFVIESEAGRGTIVKAAWPAARG